MGSSSKSSVGAIICYDNVTITCILCIMAGVLLGLLFCLTVYYTDCQLLSGFSGWYCLNKL